MGTCLLVATGDDFKVNAFLRTSSWQPVRVFRKGEVHAQRPKQPQLDSGLAVLVSDGPEHDLSRQVPEALSFLFKNELEIDRLREFGAEDVLLDFGFVPEAVLQSSVELPPDLIVALGRFRMGVLVSVVQLGRG